MSTRVAELIKKVYQEQLEVPRTRRRSLEKVSMAVGLLSAAMFLFGLIYYYNRLVIKSTVVLEDRAQIGKEIARRKNLIPNLIILVKNYASYERSVFSHTSEVRKDIGSMKNLEQVMGKLKGIKVNETLSKLLAIAEQYPDLKSETTYNELMKNLATCEDRIADARGVYNKSVNSFNTYKSRFPAIMYATLLRYKSFEFYQDDVEEDLPMVDEFEAKLYGSAQAEDLIEQLMRSAKLPGDVFGK